jgi:hypothetical protein
MTNIPMTNDIINIDDFCYQTLFNQQKPHQQLLK